MSRTRRTNTWRSSTSTTRRRGRKYGTQGVGVTWLELGIEAMCSILDLWGHKDLGKNGMSFGAPIPYHGAGLYRISPQ
jgi:hypothetical protein